MTCHQNPVVTNEHQAAQYATMDIPTYCRPEQEYAVVLRLLISGGNLKALRCRQLDKSTSFFFLLPSVIKISVLFKCNKVTWAPVQSLSKFSVDNFPTNYVTHLTKLFTLKRGCSSSFPTGPLGKGLEPDNRRATPTDYKDRAVVFTYSRGFQPAAREGYFTKYNAL